MAREALFQRWTDDEIERLRLLAAKQASAAAIAVALRRPVQSVRDKARLEGIVLPRRKRLKLS